jgi:hypothetical protein
MTALAHRASLRGPLTGSGPARRALIRWTWRLFRREWRQQLLVLVLLAVAVAAAVGSVTLVHQVIARPQLRDLVPSMGRPLGPSGRAAAA